MTDVFEAERDQACRATIIRALTERPIAYNGDVGYKSGAEEIMVLTIPDITKRYLMELWEVEE